MELKGRGLETLSFFLISLLLCKSSANSPLPFTEGCHEQQSALSGVPKAPWLGKPTVWIAGAAHGVETFDLYCV